MLALVHQFVYVGPSASVCVCWP